MLDTQRGREIAGYGILSAGAGEAHVLNICIAAAFRGRGLGRHLLGRLLDIARWNGAQQVFLEVRPSNPLAKTLYESVGFRQIGLRPRYYPAHEAVRMRSSWHWTCCLLRREH